MLDLEDWLIALAKMTIASQKGLKVDLSKINTINKKMRKMTIIFFFPSHKAESCGYYKSFQKKNKFESYFKKNQLSFVGKVIKDNKIVFATMSNKDEFEALILSLLNNKYKQGFI